MFTVLEIGEKILCIAPRVSSFSQLVEWLDLKSLDSMLESRTSQHFLARFRYAVVSQHLIEFFQTPFLFVLLIVLFVAFILFEICSNIALALFPLFVEAMFFYISSYFCCLL